MSIVSFRFILFTIAVLAMYYCIPVKNVQKAVLFCANIGFYLSFGLKSCILLLCMILISYAGALLLRRQPRKWLLFLCIVLCVLPLLLSKYYAFSLSVLEGLLKKCGVGSVRFPAFHILEPLGISFFTFRMLSYIIETYKGTFRKTYSIFDYAIYISFFPTIISGPIDQPEPFMSQLGTRKTFDHRRLVEGFLITLVGFFEKMILADRLAPIVNQVFGNYPDYRGFPLFMTSILYSCQIYLDFSGYTLIVSGIARTLGLFCSDNFEQPYFSASVQEFWRRWHISLSTWLKNYIYIPLGGNRKGLLRKNANLMATFLVSGIWHGAGWNFIAWGFLHGLYQIIGGITLGIRSRIKKLCHIYETRADRCLRVGITFLLVNFAWVIFWSSNSLSAGLHIIRDMFPLGGIRFDWLYRLGVSHTEITILIVGGLIIWLVDYLRFHKAGLVRKFFSCPAILQFSILYFLIFSILIAGYYGANYDSSSFIYFQF